MSKRKEDGQLNPRLTIDLTKLKRNAKFLSQLCEENGISMTAVTKVFCADSAMMQVLKDAGDIKIFGDSRLENIMSYPPDILQKRLLLRLPAASDAHNVVKYCDISLNSEFITLLALNTEAVNQNKVHDVILMIDLGDLREGVYYRDLETIRNIVRYVVDSKGLNLLGFGTNLTCYGSVLPTKENLTTLCEIATKMKEDFELDEEKLLISGGNSSSLYILNTDDFPKKINNLRLGESLILGKETAFGNTFEGLETDIVILDAEIIEIANKPSMPEGKININAFGETVTYEDKGVMRRALVAVGRQDVNHEGIIPLDDGVEIIGASSDHLIVDLTNASEDISLGSRLRFSLSYGAVLSTFTSKYVDKRYIYS